MFAEDGAKNAIHNWPAVSRVMLSRLRGEAMASNDQKLQSLYEELESALDTDEYTGYPPETDLPVLELVIRHGPVDLRFLSTITTFGTPLDVSVQDIRIDCMHPTDEVTKAHAMAWQ